MNRITIDFVLLMSLLAAGHRGRLHLRPAGPEPPPVVCQFCK